MATAKKTTTKKTPAKSAARTRTASTAKKSPAVAKTRKTSVAKRPATRSKKTTAKKAEMRSFHVAKDVPPFATFHVTRQTLYWTILVAFIVFAQLWILSLQVEVATLLDAQQVQLESF